VVASETLDRSVSNWRDISERTSSWGRGGWWVDLLITSLSNHRFRGGAHPEGISLPQGADRELECGGYPLIHIVPDQWKIPTDGDSRLNFFNAWTWGEMSLSEKFSMFLI